MILTFAGLTSNQPGTRIQHETYLRNLCRRTAQAAGIEEIDNDSNLLDDFVGECLLSLAEEGEGIDGTIRQEELHPSAPKYAVHLVAKRTCRRYAQSLIRDSARRGEGQEGTEYAERGGDAMAGIIGEELLREVNKAINEYTPARRSKRQAEEVRAKLRFALAVELGEEHSTGKRGSIERKGEERQRRQVRIIAQQIGAVA